MVQTDEEAYLALSESDKMQARLLALSQVLDVSGQVLLRESYWEQEEVSDAEPETPLIPLSVPGFAEAGPAFDASSAQMQEGRAAPAAKIAFLAQALGRPEGMVATALEAWERQAASSERL